MLSFLIGLVVLIIDIWAIVKAWSSPITTTAKLMWTLLIIIFPVLGVILFLLLGGTLGRKTTTV